MNLSALPGRSRAVWVLAFGLVALHVVLAERYGVFRDELYYVACGKHLAFGYVDHPPLVALMARVSTLLFGDSVRGLRVLPALLAGAAVLSSGELARVMGGRWFAQVLAGLCVALAPVLLGTGHFLSMNCVLPLTWTLAALFLVRAVVFGEQRAWIYFGLVCGVSLLAKHSTLFFGAALAAGMLATSARRVFLTRGPWIGFAIAAAMLAPNVVWEQVNGWPTLEFMHNAQTQKMTQMSAFAFLKAEALEMLPLSVPVWVGGVAWLLFARRARPFQLLGVAFVVVTAIVLLAGGKPYYLAPAFPLAYAAGGVAIEGWLANRFARAGALAIVSLGGAALAPMVLPILDVPAFLRYEAALGVTPPPDEKYEPTLLPQFQADQHGWESLATKVGAAYQALTPEERRVTTLFGANYGEAGAIDFFGPRWKLPPAWSGHNAYFTWGPPEAGRGEVMIATGHFHCEDWSNVFESVTEVDVTDDPYLMPYENHNPICVLRGLKEPLEKVWLRRRRYL